MIGDAKEMEIRGGHLSPFTFPLAIEMIQNSYCNEESEKGISRLLPLPIEEIVTHVIPMREFERGFGLVEKSSESIKVVLIPEGGTEL